MAFAQRVVGYDAPAASVDAGIMGVRKESGWSMSVPDARAAAITRCSHLAAAPLNIADQEPGVGPDYPVEQRKRGRRD